MKPFNLGTFLSAPFKLGPVLIFHIFPNRYTRGFQFKLHKRIFQILRILLIGLFLYLLSTSFMALKSEYQLWNLSKENVRLDELIVEYEQNLGDFLVEASPQMLYIANQLGSWENTHSNSALAIGGRANFNWDKSHSLEFYKKALLEKQKLVLETPNIETILSDDFKTFNQNQLIMKNLYNEIAEQKHFLSALPLNWPVLGGWGEIVPASSVSLTAPVKQKQSLNSSYSTRNQSKLIIKVLPGTPVLAAANGTVSDVQPKPDNPLAVDIVIQHDYGIQTIYEGVQKPNVRKDDVVTKQHTIGLAMDTLTYKIKLGSRFAPPEEYAFLRY